MWARWCWWFRRRPTATGPTDLTYYAAFNEVYRTYFKGPLPARAFLGADKLLGGSHFEVMGIAVRPKT